MDGQFGNAAVLQCLRQIHDNQVLFIPSKAGLDGNGRLHRIDHRAGDFQQAVRRLQQSSPCTFARYFLHRATEIDVDKVRLRLLHYLRRVRHRHGVFAVNLYRHGALRVAYLQLADSGRHITHQRVGIDELGIDPIRAKPLAEQAKSRVRNILHGGKVQHN